MLKLILLACLTLSTVQAFALSSYDDGVDSIVADFARQKKLRESAELWFQTQVAPRLPGAAGLMNVTGHGVDVEEPTFYLDPSIPGAGGPMQMVKVTVNLTGMGMVTTHGPSFNDDPWDHDSFGHDSYNTSPRPMRCKFSQQLMAKNDANGRPVKIIQSQKFQAAVGCIYP